MNFIVAHSCGSCVTLPQLFFFPKISTTSLKHKTYLKNSTTIGLQQPGLIHYFWEQHNEMVEFTIKDSPIFGLQLRQLQPGHSVRTILHYSQQKKFWERNFLAAACETSLRRELLQTPSSSTDTQLWNSLHRHSSHSAQTAREEFWYQEVADCSRIEAHLVKSQNSGKTSAKLKTKK